MRICTLLLLIWCCHYNLNSQVVLKAGLAYNTEAFNIENIYQPYIPGASSAPTNTDTSFEPYYNANKFFQSFNFYGAAARQIRKNLYVNVDMYARYNHHYYLKVPALINGLQESHKNVPQKRKLKIDIYTGLEKHITLSRNGSFLINVGLGFNQINSGYLVSYNDTTTRSYPVIGTAKGNWVKFSPRLALGYTYKTYYVFIDGYFCKDDSFNQLTTVSARITFAKKICKK